MMIPVWMVVVAIHKPVWVVEAMIPVWVVEVMILVWVIHLEENEVDTNCKWGRFTQGGEDSRMVSVIVVTSSFARFS